MNRTNGWGRAEKNEETPPPASTPAELVHRAGCVEDDRFLKRS